MTRFKKCFILTLFFSAIATNIHAADNKEALVASLAIIEAQVDQELGEVAKIMWPNVFDTLNKDQRDQFLSSKFHSIDGPGEKIHKKRPKFQNLYALRASFRAVINHVQEPK